MEQEMEKLIWDYIDGICNDAEKAAVMQKLALDPVWRHQYETYMDLHERLQNEEPDLPSLRFTKNVMEEIALYQVAPATKTYINKYIIRSIGGIFLTMIAGLLIYFLGQMHWTNPSTNHWMPQVNFQAGRLNWNRLLNNSFVNIFIGINVILALILLDKFIQGRKNTQHLKRMPKEDTA